MSNTSRSKRDVLTVFIGSPGDLQEEREEARKVVNRLNQNLARNLDLYIELRGWEDTLPGSGRPQSKINEDLRDSDLFIGLISQRWGTPTGRYSSGFQEEFELAREGRKKGELEEVWLFFKEVPDELTRDPGGQLRRVLAFKKTINAQRDIFYKTFDSTKDWSDKLYDYLANYLTRAAGTQKIAKDSLRVDDVVHGDAKKAIPDVERSSQIEQHVSHERSPKGRRMAIQTHGTTCEVCGFNFDEVYGSDYAGGYIQVHNIKPLSKYEGEVNPETDLVPLCANCHAMAHKRRDTVTSIEELKALIEKAKH